MPRRLKVASPSRVRPWKLVNACDEAEPPDMFSTYALCDIVQE